MKKASTAYWRLKECRKNPLFVEPKEIALQLKWRSKSQSNSDISFHRLVPSTFQFVSIGKTLSAILSEPDFQQMYTKYNSNEKHECKQGIYIDFCCGYTYKSKQIFADKNVVQIQIGIDDFEICSPLKTKTKKHSICGIYFQIRNLPENIVAKIDNIFLVALINTLDLKSDEILHDVLKILFKDLQILEREGFRTTDGKNWKAALVNISADNLGANFILGFSKGFHANYFCRVCEMPHDECETSTFEVMEKLRTKDSHEQHISLLNEKSSLSDTKGVRMKCLFNDLDNFDIFQNVSLDIMHDLFEGVIFFFFVCILRSLYFERSCNRKQYYFPSS